MSMEYVGVPFRVLANAIDRYGKCLLTLPGLEDEELEPGEVITLDADDCARVNIAHWMRAGLVELYEAEKGDAPLVPGVKRTKADRLAAGRAAVAGLGLATPAAPPAGGKGAADDAAGVATPEDASDSARKGERGSGSGFRPASDGGRK